MPPEPFPESELVAAVFSGKWAADGAAVDLLASGFAPRAVQVFDETDAPKEALTARRSSQDSPAAAPAGAGIPGVTVPGAIAPGGLPGDSILGVTPSIGPGIGGGIAAGLAALSLTEGFFRRDAAAASSTGRVIVKVHAGRRAAVARTILARNGGREIPSPAPLPDAALPERPQ